MQKGYKAKGDKMTFFNKYRIKNKFRFITFVTICMLVLALMINWHAGIGYASGKDATEYVRVQIKSGDTLWDLAKEYGPDNKDCRRVIYEIEQINNISAASLQVGQYIDIPVN